MTTAARPTFEPARGREKDLGALSKQYSSRDLPGHTKLKYRQSGQGAQDEVRSRDFRRELEEREERERSGKRRRDGASDSREVKALPQSTNLDADEPLRGSSSEDESDEEDDAAELQAELNRIKKQRQEEEERRDEEKRQQEEKIRMENILSGNPLLQSGSSSSKDFKVKRRWDDDVVFKNCAKGEPDSAKKGFINDTLRSEFHKKFMDKYIK